MCLLGPPAVLLLHLCDERADVLVLLRIAEVPVVHLDAFQRVVLDRHQVKEDVVSRSVCVWHSDPPFLKPCTETNRPRPSEVQGLRKDRKSTRLNSSHLGISYAVLCLHK